MPGTSASSGDPDRSERSVGETVRGFMVDQWCEPGFTCPNSTTYPWLWLWDSCFHSLIWAELGEPERALTELSSALRAQNAAGFVPHVVYYDGYRGHDRFWGAPGRSSITQPPIFGHTIAALERRGVGVPEGIKERARRAFEFLLTIRGRTEDGLIEIVHPWESGCDHSPRWDDLFTENRTPGGASDRPDVFDGDLWYRRKGQMVEALDLVDGAAVSSTDFEVGSVAFNALVAFCAAEFADVSGDSRLTSMATDLAASLAGRWDPDLGTWIDSGSTENGSGRARTIEALLPLLVETRPTVVEAVVEQILDPYAYAGRFGLRQVHPDEPTFDPDAYWRGACWPQLDYLFRLALQRRGRSVEATSLSTSTLAGTVESGFSEYWNADDGRGGGARPQSWSGLAIVSVEQDDRDDKERI